MVQREDRGWERGPRKSRQKSTLVSPKLHVGGTVFTRTTYFLLSSPVLCVHYHYRKSLAMGRTSADPRRLWRSGISESRCEAGRFSDVICAITWFSLVSVGRIQSLVCYVSYLFTFIVIGYGFPKFFISSRTIWMGKRSYEIIRKMGVSLCL